MGSDSSLHDCSPLRTTTRRKFSFGSVQVFESPAVSSSTAKRASETASPASVKKRRVSAVSSPSPAPSSRTAAPSPVIIDGHENDLEPTPLLAPAPEPAQWGVSAVEAVSVGSASGVVSRTVKRVSLRDELEIALQCAKESAREAYQRHVRTHALR